MLTSWCLTGEHADGVGVRNDSVTSNADTVESDMATRGAHIVGMGMETAHDSSTGLAPCTWQQVCTGRDDTDEARSDPASTSCRNRVQSQELLSNLASEVPCQPELPRPMLSCCGGAQR